MNRIVEDDINDKADGIDPHDGPGDTKTGEEAAKDGDKCGRQCRPADCVEVLLFQVTHGRRVSDHGEDIG